MAHWLRVQSRICVRVFSVVTLIGNTVKRWNKLTIDSFDDRRTQSTTEETIYIDGKPSNVTCSGRVGWKENSLAWMNDGTSARYRTARGKGIGHAARWLAGLWRGKFSEGPRERASRALVLDLDGDQDVPARRAAKSLAVIVSDLSVNSSVAPVYSMRSGNILHAFAVSARLYYYGRYRSSVYIPSWVWCVCASCRSVESSRRIIVVARRERESKDEEREPRCVCVSVRTIFSSIVDIFEDGTSVSPERRIVITALANISTVG